MTMSPGSDQNAPHFLIVESPYYREVTDALAQGATAVLDAAGATYERLEVPGALEIPGAIALAEPTGSYDGYLALGCVIRGETSHYDIVCEQSAAGLQMLAIQDMLAIGNGILTVENHKQAMARALPSEKNKGKDVAEAALRMVELTRHFQQTWPSSAASMPESE